MPRSVTRSDATRLFCGLRDLLSVDSLDEAARCVCALVREIVDADGATFVLREGDQVYYAEEDAVGPLWRGRRFPVETCISGWATVNRETAVIEDIYDDARLPVDAYRPTFVQSLCMAPVGRELPLGAVGAYWARRHRASEREIWLVEQIADAAHGVARRAVETRPPATAPPEGVGARLLSVIAHDLRQPLSTIDYGAQLLLEDVDESRRQIAERIARSASNASRLVDQMSELSALERGGLRLRLDDVLLDEVCEAIASELDPVRQRIQVRAAPTQVLADEDRIHQAIANLVGNALQHGHGDRPVTLWVNPDGDQARVAVHNQGPAIPADRLQAIFLPFHRPGGRSCRGSVGLGLHIAEQIVRAHGGKLDVHSSDHEGTTFLMELPVAATTLMAS